MKRVDLNMAKEKANVRWIDMADSNNKFYHAAISERRATNKILSIFSRQGLKLVEFADIEAECLEYFSEVFGPSMDEDYDPSLVEYLQFERTITDDMADQLVLEVTRDEIVVALASIGSDKAPGLSSFFFKYCWKIVGNDFVLAVKNFIKKKKMLGEVNATAVTLVPQIRNPATFSDFRPISCCNVLYKCITKILTIRMKDAVRLVVSPCQSAFIKGRVIQDNILLSHELMRNYHCE